jgi:XTP/dITP diphosphohydrolase
MTSILIATRNAHKAAEIRRILAGDFRFLTQADFPAAPAAVEDAGTFAGNALKKAEGLASWVAANPQSASPGVPLYVLADDSGLEVDALGGQPGVHSARFAAGAANSPDALASSGTATVSVASVGVSPAESVRRRTSPMGQQNEDIARDHANSPDAANNAKLLRLLEGIPHEKRTARFRCVLALAAPGGPVRLFEGACEGRIALAPAGARGFGYDPLFVPEGCDRSFAELGDEVKNNISHRARALAALRRFLNAAP